MPTMTKALREQHRVGQQIAAQLDARMTREEVAKKLGISKTMVKNLEYQALHKVALRLRSMMEAGDFDMGGSKEFAVPSARYGLESGNGGRSALE